MSTIIFFSIEELSLQIKTLSEENVCLKAQLNEVLGRLDRFETSQLTIINLLTNFTSHESLLFFFKKKNFF